MIVTGYKELNLIYYFTAGETEVGCSVHISVVVMVVVMVVVPPTPGVMVRGGGGVGTFQPQGAQHHVPLQSVTMATLVVDTCARLSFSAVIQLLKHLNLDGGLHAAFKWLSCMLQVRCWTILQGTLAPQAAGVIHTDFERGFIKAEVVSFDDFKRSVTTCFVACFLILGGGGSRQQAPFIPALSVGSHSQKWCHVKR
jgi:hypothetical protein